MKQYRDSESGYLDKDEADCYFGSVMRDVEIIHVGRTNVIAQGHRYGRRWFIKSIHEEFRDSVVIRRRLIKEFEIHSRLNNPAVVQAVGLEEIEGLGLSIVQEWVEGNTLQEVLGRKELLSSEKRRIIRELVKATAYVHSNGIVHRDLKPSNVMLRDIGRKVVLIDFGLADTSDYVELKASAGTPGYISPEQETSGGANPTDDVYSIGVIMNQLTPCYRSISTRCIGPLAKRPADAGHLLKIIERRDHRPKLILIAVVTFAVALLTGFAVYRINSLENILSRSEKHVSELSLKNSVNLERISSLQDSLLNVKNSLEDANVELSKITEYENLKQDSFIKGCNIIDKELSNADKKIFSKLKSGQLSDYNIRLIELTHQLKNSVESYCNSLESTSLKSHEVDKIRMDLYSYISVKLSEYQEKWLKKINVQI